MIEFLSDFPISELSPADYNPRRIDDESFQLLRESIERFGLIKPVLLNGNGTLMAGHQRIKALIANGKTLVPALRTKSIGLKDEARLNLYHNSVETGRSHVRLKERLTIPGYHLILPTDLDIVRPENPAIVAEICRLILKCGEWGSLIVSSKLERRSSLQRGLCCRDRTGPQTGLGVRSPGRARRGDPAVLCPRIRPIQLRHPSGP